MAEETDILQFWITLGLSYVGSALYSNCGTPRKIYFCLGPGPLSGHLAEGDGFKVVSEWFQSGFNVVAIVFIILAAVPPCTSCYRIDLSSRVVDKESR